VALGVIGLGAFLLVSAGHALARRGAPVRLPPSVGADFRRIGALRTATAIGWAATGIVLENAALGAALHGVGGQVPVLESAAVYAVFRLAWAALPPTRLPGIAEVSLVLGLTVFGESLSSACAGVLTFRLLTYWAPAALGSFLAARFAHRLFL
jgi:undecaprenyl-diphosphatase